MAKLNEDNIIYDGTKKVSIDGIDVYTSNEVDNKLVVKAEVKDIYNKSEVDNKLKNKADISDLSNYASRGELRNKVDDTVIGNLGNTGFKNNNSVEEILIEVKSELDKKQSRSDSVNVKNDISKVNTIIGNIRQTGFSGNTISEQLREAKVLLDGNRYTRSSPSVDLSNYYTKSEVYNKEEVDQKIAHVATGGSVDLSNYATKQELAKKANVSDLGAKLDESVYTSDKATFATKSELTNKANASEITRIDSEISSINSNISTKADNSDYQATKINLTSLETKIGDLQNTGLTGSTVTELLTDVKSKIDGVQVGSGSVNLTNYYTKDEIKDLLEHEADTQFNEAVFKYREKIDGLDNAIKNSSSGPVFRIPSLTISENGTIHVVSDCRDTGSDQDRIEVVYARSVDGGNTWTKKVIGHRYKGSGYSESQSRVMDPTILDAGNNTLFVLAGRWITGGNNWTQNGATANNWSAALLMKSTDDGKTWSQHTIGKADCTSKEGTHITVQNLRSGCKGFLGGINPGFRHSSGKLIFQIQFTTGNGDAKSTLLISDDNGVNWRMAGGDTGGVNYECSMIELSDKSIVLHTRSEDADAVVDGKSTKKAYRTTDFGETWNIYEPLNKKVGSKQGNVGGHRCEGGTLGGTTINGTYICAAAYPQVTADTELGSSHHWGRNQITIYACNLDNGTVKPIQMLHYRSGLTPVAGTGPGSTSGTPYGGYSSLIYKQSVDGEYIVAVFEDELGISIKNLSHLIPRLESYASGSGLTPSEITEIKKIPTKVEIETSQFPENFSSFINTSKIEGNKLELIGSDCTVKGTLNITGAYLSGSSIDPSKISPSDKFDGGLHLNMGSGIGSIKGNCILDTSATVISIAFGLYIPTQSGQGSYTSIIRFFNHATSMDPSNMMGGIEIHTDGKFYITKANNGSITNQGLANYQKDLLYNVVVEYNGTSAKLFLNGTLAGTATIPSNYVELLRSASYVSLGNPGINNKSLDVHIGNLAIYSRELSDVEKKNVIYVNGKNVGINSFNRINELIAKIEALEAKITQLHP